MQRFLPFSAVLFFGALLSTVAAQTPTCPCKLIADLNKLPATDPSSYPGPINTTYDWTNMRQGYRFTEMGGWLYFRATTSTTGYELWKMKGPGTCTLVKDAIPGITSQNIYDAAAHPTMGKLLFYRGLHPHRWQRTLAQ